MSAINDGGAAFPSKLPKNADQHLLDVISSGMSLRDYFAGQALAGVLANTILLEMHESYAMTAEACMNFADAMLAARAEKNQTKEQS